MIYYILAAVVVAILIGLIVGISSGREQGYNHAVGQYQQQMANVMWTEYLKNLGGKND